MKSITKSLSGLVLCCVIGLLCTPLLLGGVSNVAYAAPADSAAAVSAAIGHVDVAAADAQAKAPVVEPTVVQPDLLSTIGDWLQVLSMVIAACAGVAALTPTPKDDGVFLLLRKVVDFLALNFGHAANGKSISSDRFTN